MRTQGPETKTPLSDFLVGAAGWPSLQALSENLRRGGPNAVLRSSAPLVAVQCLEEACRVRRATKTMRHLRHSSR